MQAFFSTRSTSFWRTQWTPVPEAMWLRASQELERRHTPSSLCTRQLPRTIKWRVLVSAHRGDHNNLLVFACFSPELSWRHRAFTTSRECNIIRVSAAWTIFGRPTDVPVFFMENTSLRSCRTRGPAKVEKSAKKSIIARFLFFSELLWRFLHFRFAQLLFVCTSVCHSEDEVLLFRKNFGFSKNNDVHPCLAPFVLDALGEMGGLVSSRHIRCEDGVVLQQIVLCGQPDEYSSIHFVLVTPNRRLLLSTTQRNLKSHFTHKLLQWVLRLDKLSFVWLVS